MTRIVELSNQMKSVIEVSCLETLRKLETPEDPNVLHELLQLFHQSSEMKLQSLASSLTRRDYQQMSNDAHSLKATCATLGAHGLSQTCRKLEAAVLAGDLQKTTELLEQLQAGYLQVKQELKERVLPAV